MLDRIKNLINRLKELFTEKELEVLNLPESSKYGIKPEFTYGMFMNKPSSQYHIAKLDIDTYKFLLYLQHPHVQKHIEENNGKLKITIKVGKSKAWYGSLDSNEWKKQKELTSKEHSPDRAVTYNNASDDDLPF